MEITLTCKECGSGINFIPVEGADSVQCHICETKNPVTFNDELLAGNIRICPSCGRKDFYKQKDFNRKIGVLLFVIASILAIWTYGISLIVLYIFDFLLYKKIGDVVACYKCNTLFRKVNNIDSIHPFDHEMNDRIVYSNHDFDGKSRPH